MNQQIVDPIWRCGAYWQARRVVEQILLHEIEVTIGACGQSQASLDRQLSTLKVTVNNFGT